MFDFYEFDRGWIAMAIWRVVRWFLFYFFARIALVIVVLVVLYHALVA